MANHVKWALVTGACGGIGSALVDVFADNDYKVIATDRLKEHTFRAPNIHYLQIHLERFARSQEYAEQVGHQVMGICGTDGLSVLINNAAVQNLARLDSINRVSWSETLDVNVTAPLFLSQLFSDSLAANAGSVINVSSIHAHLTKPDFFAYATSKAALSALTRSLAVAVGPSIRVNAIEPAAVGTPMLKQGFSGNDEKLKQLEDFHPVRRIADPEEIAELALFLCSKNASFIHGECISISGGIDRRLYDPD